MNKFLAIFLTLAALVSTTAGAQTQINTCKLNEAAGLNSKSANQFVCVVGAKVFTIRCDRSGEGGNFQIGSWTCFGQNCGVEFKAAQNNGNEGFAVCPVEFNFGP